MDPNNSKKRKECPYLDTINRQALDFDFEASWCEFYVLL